MTEEHFFRYDIYTNLAPLQRISVAGAEFNGGGDEFTKRKQYKEISTREPAHIKTYGSTLTVDRYLVIVRIEAYAFVFYIPDDACLLAWRREYEQIPASFLAQKLLPPPKSLPEMQQFSMNKRALR